MHLNYGLAFPFLWLYLSLPTLATTPQPSNTICKAIQKVISTASNVYFPGQPQYESDIHHWTPSVAQTSLCSVEPGTAADVQLLGITRTPFAVKSGGHTVNPGFSSTPGVHIALSRFKNISYNAKDKTATVGAGLIWDDVYAALAPYNVSVVGARAPGLGVGGFALGGGYSYVTNQFGLSMDNVVGYQLVKPDGHIVSVTKASDPDLFFGLKGGFNNFGIVTQFTLQAIPQSAIWGGTITYSTARIDEVLNAIALYAAKANDPKANVAALAVAIAGQPQINVLLFYDATLPPKGLFDIFTNIPSLSNDLSTRSMLSLVQSFGGFDGLRVAANGVPAASYSKTMLNAIWNETIYWGSHLPAAVSPIVSYAIEPLLPSAFTHAISETAYLSAKSRSQHLNPTGLVFGYTGDATQAVQYDPIFRAAIRQSAAQLRQVAERSGQPSDAVAYPNYAITDTPLVKLYGENLPRLKDLKRRVDPLNVMGLAGGWKF